MSLYCDADYDVMCQARKSGRTGKSPQCKVCCYRIETYDLLPCKCGTSPQLLEEGTAQRIIRSRDEKGPFKWVGESRFAVKCPSCSAATPLLESPERAAAEWNKYCGDFPEVTQQ